MTATPMDPIRQLCERLKDEADKMGLHLQQVAILPHSPDVDMPDMMQCVFVVKPEAVVGEGFVYEGNPEDAEQAKIDAEFDALMGNMSAEVVRDKLEDKKSSAVEDLTKWLEGK